MQAALTIPSNLLKSTLQDIFNRLEELFKDWDHKGDRTLIKTYGLVSTRRTSFPLGVNEMTKLISLKNCNRVEQIPSCQYKWQLPTYTQVWKASHLMVEIYILKPRTVPVNDCHQLRSSVGINLIGNPFPPGTLGSLFIGLKSPLPPAVRGCLVMFHQEYVKSLNCA